MKFNDHTVARNIKKKQKKQTNKQTNKKKCTTCRGFKVVVD